MQSISKIFESYKITLDNTYEQQIENIEHLHNRVKVFYKSFLNKLVISYGNSLSNPHENFLIKETIKDVFQTDNIKFVAIDGSSFKDEFSEFIVFYGGAYAVRGSLKLKENPVKIEYEKWDIKYDKSIVAYIPIPYIDLNFSHNEEMFFSTDKEKTQYINIHNQLMQLAEIYLAYTFINNPDTDINLVLLDNSLSSIYLSNDVLHLLDKYKLKIIDYNFRRNKLTPADIYTSYGMPINEDLDIPSCKNFHGEFYILRKLFNNTEFKNDCPHIREDKHLSKLKRLGIISFDSNTQNIKVNPEFGKNIKESWEYVKDLYKYICEELFVNRNIHVLKVRKEDKEEWLTSDDIKFLISVGLRMLIEESWKKNVLIIGIAKDSASKYFIKNYIGVMKHIGAYNFVSPGIVASDRLILEFIPFIDQSISAPWSTVEFDSVFMSLHLVKNEKGNVQIEGVRGDIIVPQERLFLRSLAQFYVDRSKKDPRTGNVIFIDRVVHPILDAQNRLSETTKKVIRTYRGDEVDPIIYDRNTKKNKAQQALIYVIDTLTKNLFPNIIGYPDPLHKADWGAKSMNKKIRELIRSSEIKFIADPLKKSFRQKREEGYRGK